MRSSLFILVFIIALLVAGGFYFSFMKNEPADSSTAKVSTSTDNSQETTELKEPDRAELKAVDGSSSSGNASRLTQDNNTTVIIFADLPKLTTPDFYAGWLIKKDADGSIKFSKIGKMIIQEESWYLNYQTKDDLSGYNELIISKENSDNATPGEHILEGSF